MSIRSTFSVLLSSSILISNLPAATLTGGHASSSLSLISTEQANGIYQHLIHKHWVPQTGLFLSFADVGDRKLIQQSSTYEQGAVGILLLKVGDVPRAKQLFQFLKKAWNNGPLPEGYRTGVKGFANFYNAQWGTEGIEKIIHVGPNAWAGIFIARYGNQYGVREASNLALEMANWMRTSVPHENGGIAMGPISTPGGVPWTKVYSVENNLSYLAFLKELHKSPFITAQTRTDLLTEITSVQKWVFAHGFDRKSYLMNRGKNPLGVDRVRALDTHTWLVSAIHPDHLRTHGMNPDHLMRKIQQLFLTRVNDRMGVDPTDQAEADRTAAEIEQGPNGETARATAFNNRLTWYEGLGQYLTALTVMRTDSQKRGRSDLAQLYQEKLETLTHEFDAASLSQYPRGTAFQYATQGKFFHDGWWSPAESDKGPASSLIAGTWRLFVGMGFDPLTGDTHSFVEPATIAWQDVASPPREKEALLFGTSEDMVVQAWNFLEAGKPELAQAQAEATIQEWASFAVDLQRKKQIQHGNLLEDYGDASKRQAIFSYWALNDVAAAYYVVGKILDSRGDTQHAHQAFQQIMTKYPLAQVWDPKGWFWSPAEAIWNEYSKRLPDTYGDLIPPFYAASASVSKPTY